MGSQTSSPDDRMTFDDIRAANPELGLALYALEPGGPITLEIMAPDGQVYSFVAQTETEVLSIAFPPDAPAPTDPEPTTDIFA